MLDESQQSVAQLRQEMDSYQTRLDNAEKLAAMDALTGLDNRRKVEASIEFRLTQGRMFSVLLLDLNGFKQVNDSYGHVAGDELLKKFAGELKAGCRAIDLVGRLGWRRIHRGTGLWLR